MIGWNRTKVIPAQLFPGDYCLACIDPAHEDECYMLEYHPQPDGTVAVIKCGCTESVTANAPGRYVVRITQLQHD